jgi:hypothetical protein
MCGYKTIATLLLGAATVCGAAELILPGPALERDRPVTLIYKTGLQATGKGELRVNWTDVLGRVVENRTIPVELIDENEIRFPLDLRRAVAMQNELHVHFSFNGINKKGKEDHREEDASASFIARPPDSKWWDYMIIMWQDGSAEHFTRLEKIGVNAGKSSEHSDQLPEALLKDNLRWYVENMATDFYSAYHIYRPDRPYNWAFLQAKELYRRDPSSKEGLKRHPSFSDPQWLAKIHDRLVESARTFSPYRPIFYNLADESGIAELAGFWDFDFSDHSLDEMRTWLKNRYGTLAALNGRWGTNFTTWDLVTPDTTREAMKRTDENYSSWADFKEWMAISYSGALKMGVDAIHSIDPHAYVGIEGAQMPGWGGYDYARLSKTLDAMEPYDIGDNIEIIRSLNPDLAFITTAFATGPLEKHRVWYELLHGARGQIIWDEKHDIIEPDGTVGARGRDVAPYWNELRDGIGALMINSVRQADPIAIHYSQASMRTEWMKAQRPKGDAWMDRMSWTERKDSDFLRLRDSYCRLIEDHGLQYNFVSYGQVENGQLLKGGYRMLILPRSSALSPAEANAITDFVHQGGILVVDGDAGTFDQHSRRLPKSSLAGLLAGDTGRGKVVHLSALDYRQQRILGTGGEVYKAMSKVISDAGVHPEFAVVDAQGNSVPGIETHVFRNGAVSIVGLLSNPPIEQNELGPLKVKSEQRFEKPVPIRLIAPVEMYAYDVRRAKPLGRVKQLPLTIDPYEPAIIAFSPTPEPKFRINAPQRIARGETGRIGLAAEGHSPALADVFHIDVLGPDGKPISQYSGNVLAPHDAAEKMLPLALNDVPGKWTIEAKDLLSGEEQRTAIEVF